MFPASVYGLYGTSFAERLIPQMPTTYERQCVLSVKLLSEAIREPNALGQVNIPLML